MEAQTSALLGLIPLFPAIGALLNAFFGARMQRSFGPRANHGIAIAAMLASCAVAWIAFFQLFGLEPENRALSFVAWDWLHVGLVDARFAFWLDPLSSMMCLIITTIGTLIHLYAVGYMHGDKSYWRFFCYLNLFVTMMLLLVLGDNFLLMFIGWEGVGLASYLLIGFWYKELANAGAGMKAFVVNRFGDACFVIGLFVLFWGLQGDWAPSSAHDKALSANTSPFAKLLPKYVKDPAAADAEQQVGPRATLASTDGPAYSSLSFHRLRQIFEAEGEREQLKQAASLDSSKISALTDFDKVRGRSPIAEKTVFGLPIIFVICVLFFLGATAKSAQIPFYVWLPDAMAGPTPVSALIHAATMVTAGVYMVARLNFLFILSPGACTVVALVGALTALFAASMGLFQYDIKKVLAYSTVSQLGFMFIGVGVGAYWAGVFHLLTHACFKACLFLGSGSVILGCHHEQDMRRMGGLKKFMPSTHWTYAFACFAIAGFPLAAGFCSKDEILWKAFSSSAVLPYANYLIWGMGLAAATLTAFYMYRSYYLTFTGPYKGNALSLPDLYPRDTARAQDLFIPKPVRGPTPEMLASMHAEHGGHDHGSHGAHGGHDGHHDHDAHHDDHHGGGEPHESPWTMTLPLWILGIASLILGVIVGFPPVVSSLLHLDVHPALEHWLAPVLSPGMNMMKHYDAVRPNLPWLADTHMLHLSEYALAAMSVLVAGLGWGLARYLYKDGKNPLPQQLLATPKAILGETLGNFAHQAHRVIFNKYFIDEGYYLVMVRGMSHVWNGLKNIDVYIVDGLVNGAGLVGKYFGYFQGAIDKYIVDGAVNLVGQGVTSAGTQIRRMQTGQIRIYLLGAFGGTVAVLLLLIALS